MSDSTDEQWSKLSLLVANDPDNFENWENLVRFSSSNLSKVTPTVRLELFRITNDQFLLKFPFMEQYWITYAEKEFKLGYTEKSLAVYEQALEVLPFSNLVWLSYLRLLKETELDYSKLLSYYKRAEVLIGLHYHSYEFWKDFIDVEHSYNGKSLHYFNLLKKVVAIPMFNYSYFFSLLFKEIDNITEMTILKLVPQQELNKKFKLQMDETFTAKNIDYHDVKSKLKKVFTDSYITTQFKSFEQYYYEKNIKLEYFVPGLYKTYQELADWESYISYMELNGTFNQIEQLYHRALVPLANYPQIWLKFADFYLSKNNIQAAKQVLHKSALFLTKSNLINIQLKLIKIELMLNNIIKARDIAQLILDNNKETGTDISYDILVEFVKVDNILSFNKQESFRGFLVELIQNIIPAEASLLLIDHISAGFHSIEAKSELIKILNSNERFTKELKYWITLLNTLEYESADRLTINSTYRKAISSLGGHQLLLQWYDRFLGYEMNEKDELAQYFEQASSSLFD
jgi:pre-mRNA-processing factor 39